MPINKYLRLFLANTSVFAKSLKNENLFEEDAASGQKKGKTVKICRKIIKEEERGLLLL